MTHYDTLQIPQTADAASIRSAYRSLMRVYHPDINCSPEAQQYARGLTAAFAELGDPERRAAYDWQLSNSYADLTSFLVPVDHPIPPKRNAGVGKFAFAGAVTATLAVAIWLNTNQPGNLEASSFDARSIHKASEMHSTPKITRKSSLLNAESSRSEATAATAYVRAPAATQVRSAIGAAEIADVNVSVSAPVRVSAPIEARKQITAVPIQMVKPQTGGRASGLAPSRGCSGSPTQDGNQACLNNRIAENERMASDLFRRSMATADWHIQDLLLSAQHRAVFSRAACRTDDCVIATYTRQMRQTTEIMQGRIPALDD